MLRKRAGVVEVAVEVVSPGFEAAERLVQAAIAAALVPLWVVALAAHLSRPYVAAVTGRFGVRLAGEIWHTTVGALRDVSVLAVFLLSFLYFYPDAVIDGDFPITGGVAGAIALAVLVLKLVDASPGGRATFRGQAVLLGLGAGLYVVPYLLATQLTGVSQGVGPFDRAGTSFLLGAHNQGWAVALCALAQESVAVLAAISVVHAIRFAPAGMRQAPATAPKLAAGSSDPVATTLGAQEPIR